MRREYTPFADIEAARLARNLTWEEIAEELKLHKTTYHGWKKVGRVHASIYRRVLQMSVRNKPRKAKPTGEYVPRNAVLNYKAEQTISSVDIEDFGEELEE